MANQRHATRKKQPKARQFDLPAVSANLLGRLTRLHIILLSVAACSLVLGVTSFSGKQDDPVIASSAETSSTNRLSKPLSLKQADDLEKKIYSLAPDPAAAIFDTLQPEALKRVIDAEDSTRTVTRIIKNGDNLSSIFLDVGLNARDVYNITASGKEGKALTRMYPGEALEFTFNTDNSLKRITRQKSALEAIYFTPDSSGFGIERVIRAPEIRQIHNSGIVEHSLALAANRSGLSSSLTMNMANIFGGVIDFVYDVRGGDRFTVVYEEHYLDGEKIDEGNIIAAQYVNRGTIYNAFRYEHTNGDIGYYNEEGESMRKAFLRAPLDFTRVSSGFNLKRLHPITKKVKPHRGIDYAAPVGTPVFSVGEGRVVASGYSNANGKYVFIKHGEAYTTKYLHLSRRNVKKGQRVKQGQIIGKVGCTGLCTGPHLHYEFLVNGVHRNPRTIVKKLPKAKKLPSSELPAFEMATADGRKMLSTLSSQFELASAQ